MKITDAKPADKVNLNLNRIQLYHDYDGAETLTVTLEAGNEVGISKAFDTIYYTREEFEQVIELYRRAVAVYEMANAPAKPPFPVFNRRTVLDSEPFESRE
jgi:hypothetical protein